MYWRYESAHNIGGKAQCWALFCFNEWRKREVVTTFYNMIDEEERLQSRHGQVEFQTTMKSIHDYLKPGMRVLEIGASNHVLDILRKA